MKINEVIISEQPVAGTQQPAMYKPADTTFATNYSQRNRAGFVPDVATTKPGPGQAPQPAPKKKSPKKQAPKKPVDAMANSYAGDQTSSGYTAQSQAQKSPEPAAPVDQAAVPASANASSSYTGAQPAPAEPVAGQRPGGIAFNQDAGTTPGQPAPAEPVAGQRPGGIAFNQDAGTTPGQAAQPAPAAAQPAPAPAAPSTVAPAVTSSSGQPVKTGTGGTLTSRSGDEIAWAQKFGPFGPPAGTSYPGAGNWDPRTGRTIKKEDAEIIRIKTLSGLR
jgi:hypothetical protein